MQNLLIMTVLLASSVAFAQEPRADVNTKLNTVSISIGSKLACTFTKNAASLWAYCYSAGKLLYNEMMYVPETLAPFHNAPRLPDGNLNPDFRQITFHIKADKSWLASAGSVTVAGLFK